MTAYEGGGRRLLYIDALRIIAAFLVIVNHTVSNVIFSTTAGEAQWWLSIVWYYVSKIAVPLFIMVSGACQLGKVDSYRKTLWRIVRVVLAMLLFSYIFYLYDAWVYYGLWPRAVNIGQFVSLVWRCGILDDYWYIFMYVGLLLMLPCLQRMAERMKSRDILYLVGMTFLLDALWALVTHYVPGLALSYYFDAPLFSVFIGCFFLGYWIRKYLTVSRRAVWLCLAGFVATVAISALLTYIEAQTTTDVNAMLFMDERTQPSIFMLAGAACAMIIMKGALSRPASPRRERVTRELGGCAFAIYLMQGFLIAQTEKRLFEPLCAVMPAFAAALCWELCVFAAALAAAWVLRKVPGIKRVL